MAGKSQFKKPAAGPRNEWLRQVIRETGITQVKLAAALDRRIKGASYSKWIVGDMVVDREITDDEVRAIADETGQPLPDDVPPALPPSTAQIVADIESLEDEGIGARAAVQAVIAALKVARDRQGSE